MRTFYLFLIRDDIYNITKNNPLDLYLSFEKIYKMDKKDANLGYSIYKKIASQIDRNYINKTIFSINESNVNYTTYKNNHIINNFYDNENTKLTIYNSYIMIKTNKSVPSFLNDIKSIKNIFVIDFQNDDYFFLDKVLMHV